MQAWPWIVDRHGRYHYRAINKTDLTRPFENHDLFALHIMSKIDESYSVYTTCQLYFVLHYGDLQKKKIFKCYSVFKQEWGQLLVTKVKDRTGWPRSPFHRFPRDLMWMVVIVERTTGNSRRLPCSPQNQPRAPSRSALRSSQALLVLKSLLFNNTYYSLDSSRTTLEQKPANYHTLHAWLAETPWQIWWCL